MTVTEGDSGSVAATFTVSMNVPSGRAASVGYATADGTATAPGDYASAGGTLNFAAGQTTRTFTVNVNGDVTDELDETFTVTLSTAVNATILDGQGIGTITDDDGFPSLSINDVTVTETNSSVNAVFNVTLSNASGQTVTVAFATADGTAIAGADYTSASGTLEFTPGQLTRTITVPVTGDLLDEIDENFTVTLTNPVERVDHRRHRARDDRRQRPDADPDHQRHDRGRGRLGHHRRDLHGHAERAERPRHLG